MPFQRTPEKIAIPNLDGHQQNRDGREAVWVAIGLAAVFKMTVGFEVAQVAFKLDPVGSLDAERLRDVAFRRQGGIVGDPFEDLVSGRDASHVIALSRVERALKMQRSVGCER